MIILIYSLYFTQMGIVLKLQDFIIAADHHKSRGGRINASNGIFPDIIKI